MTSPRRTPKMARHVALSLLITGTLLILAPTLWVITGEWRWAVGLLAATLIGLLYTALAINQTQE